METKHVRKIEQMIEAFNQVTADFKWEHQEFRFLIALTYAVNNRMMNTEKIKTINQYIKDSTKLFSPFRGMLQFPLSGFLCATQESPERMVDKMLSLEPYLKQVGFKNATYLPMSCYTMATTYEGDDIEGYLEKAHDIYKQMRSDHPFLTSGDDYGMAILLASRENKSEMVEDYYHGLDKNGFDKTNGLQMLSHIMALSDLSVEESIRRCSEIKVTLKGNGLRINPMYYAVIGILALTYDQINMDEVIEVAKHLKTIKKYKWAGKDMRVLMAALVVASDSIETLRSEMGNEMTGIGLTIQSVILAQQAAMMAAVSASVAASTAAST